MAIESMDPGLWGNLPTELLQLVFSRLGGAEICRLRILSKKWKRDIDRMRAEFNWDPNLWGTLPTELLRLVFSRLRLADIGRLRILSKEWKRDIDSMMNA
jgi:hypothetical protein